MLVDREEISPGASYISNYQYNLALSKLHANTLRKDTSTQQSLAAISTKIHMILYQSFSVVIQSLHLILEATITCQFNHITHLNLMNNTIKFYF